MPDSRVTDQCARDVLALVPSTEDIIHLYLLRPLDEHASDWLHEHVAEGAE
jgi:hypothetical protein